MNRLKDKNTIITGATGGIGRATCESFCKEGAAVIGVGRNDKIGMELETEFKKLGYNFKYKHCDVTSSDDIKRLFEYVSNQFSNLDVLINNAGVILGKPFMETTEEDWDRIHNINLKSVFIMMRAFVPLMKQRGGSIVNISSIGGIVAFDMMSAYSAAKGGLIMLTKGAAADLGPHQIRVNVVHPGVIDTPMPRSFMTDLSEKEKKDLWDGFADQAILKRVGVPADIAPLLLYLASDESRFMTGSEIVIDGGWVVK